MSTQTLLVIVFITIQHRTETPLYLQNNLKCWCGSLPVLYEALIWVTFVFVSVTLSNALSSVKFAVLNQSVVGSPLMKISRPTHQKTKIIGYVLYLFYIDANKL